MITPSFIHRALGHNQSLWRWWTGGEIPAGRLYRGRQILFTDEEVAQISTYTRRIGPLGAAEPKQLGLFNGFSGGTQL